MTRNQKAVGAMHKAVFFVHESAIPEQIVPPICTSSVYFLYERIAAIHSLPECGCK